MAVSDISPPPSTIRSADHPRRPTWFWQAAHLLCFLWFVPMYRFRAWGVGHVPMTGATLLISNHQSYLDPIVVGLPLARRRFFALARKTLWRNRAVGRLIDQLNAIPVDQDQASQGKGGDLKAVRRCVEILKQGEALLVFPEGSRTPAGSTQAFAAGTMLLIKRARPTIVPVALEGPFHIWPISKKLPRMRGRVGVMYGEPIAADALTGMSPDEALTHLRDRVEAMRVDLAQRLRD